jgi:putative DNA primase/helicase
MIEDEIGLPDIEEEEPDNLEIVEEQLIKEEAKQEPQVWTIPDEIQKRPNYELDIKYILEDEIFFNSKAILDSNDMAQILQRDNYFITDGFSGELFVYINHGPYAGTYIEATKSLELAIKQVATKFRKENYWTRYNKRKEIYSWINQGLRTLESPDTRHLNVANGLIYLAPNGEFIDFINDWTPDYLTTVKLPIRYDPKAKCPAWEKFVDEVFPSDSKQVAWEILALLMLPLKNKSASAIILKGVKNSGKSTFQNGVIAFLGEANVCNLSLDQFGERFQNTQLKGRLANIVGELPNIKINAKATNAIKRLIGNDKLSGEVKNGAVFMFESYARCLFSCNEMPICDNDDAFFDRFNIIPFNNSFKKDPIKEAELKESLSSQEELSGLLNKALAVLTRVVKGGISITGSMKDEHKVVTEDNDPLNSLKEHVDLGPEYATPCRELHDFYKSLEPND